MVLCTFCWTFIFFEQLTISRHWSNPVDWIWINIDLIAGQDCFKNINFGVGPVGLGDVRLVLDWVMLVWVLKVVYVIISSSVTIAYVIISSSVTIAMVKWKGEGGGRLLKMWKDGIDVMINIDEKNCWKMVHRGVVIEEMRCNVHDIGCDNIQIESVWENGVWRELWGEYCGFKKVGGWRRSVAVWLLFLNRPETV